MDKARKLSKNGVSTKIIPPYGKMQRYRLAIADMDTWQQAEAKANELQGEYEGAWVLKY